MKSKNSLWPKSRAKPAVKPRSVKHSRKRLSIRRELDRKVAETSEEAGHSKRHREHGCSKYRPEYGLALLAYFNVEAITIAVDARTGLTTPVFANWPTFEGFAVSIGCVADTVRRWASEVDRDGKLLRPDFSAYYARARERQKDLLMQGGMSGAYSSGFATLAAKNVLGWKDKIETDANVRIEAVDPAVLDAIYNAKRAESAAMNATRGR